MSSMAVTNSHLWIRLLRFTSQELLPQRGRTLFRRITEWWPDACRRPLAHPCLQSHDARAQILLVDARQQLKRLGLNHVPAREAGDPQATAAKDALS